MDAIAPSEKPVAPVATIETVQLTEVEVKATTVETPVTAAVKVVPTSRKLVDDAPLESGEFIVLVELPANGQGNALASTKGKAQYWMIPNDEKLKKRMEDRRKQFFRARLRADGVGLKLGKYAPYQEW